MLQKCWCACRHGNLSGMAHLEADLTGRVVTLQALPAFLKLQGFQNLSKQKAANLSCCMLTIHCLMTESEVSSVVGSLHQALPWSVLQTEQSFSAAR